MQAGAINDPHHVSVETLARSPFLWIKVRVLKLNNKTKVSADICDVPLSGFRIILDEFLKFGWKIILPRAMPLSLFLGPRIAIPSSAMCPVRNSVGAAFGNNLAITRRARPATSGKCLDAVTG